MIEITWPLDLEKIKKDLVASGFQINKKFGCKKNGYSFGIDSYELSFKYNNSNILITYFDDADDDFECNLSTNINEKFYDIDSKNNKITLFDDFLKEHYDNLKIKNKQKLVDKATSTVSKIMLTSFIEGHLRNQNIKFKLDEALPKTILMYACSCSKIQFRLCFSFKSFKHMTDVDLKDLNVTVGRSNKKMNFQTFIDNFETYLKQAKDVKKNSEQKKEELLNKIIKLKKELYRIHDEYYKFQNEDYLSMIDFNKTC